MCLVAQSSQISLEETCDYCEDFFHFKCGGIKLNSNLYYDEITYACPFCFLLIVSRNNIKPHPNYFNQAAIGMELEYKCENNNSILLMPTISGNEMTEDIKESEKTKLLSYLKLLNLTFNDDLIYEDNVERLNDIKYEPHVQVF